ncbi:MAG: hypothetical protein Q7T69_06540 [Rhodoferax sp.]|nr:hypothetical protein [Rhodoferax sp.]
MITSHFAVHRCVLTFVGTLIATGAALAGPSSSAADAQARYRQEMALCNSGQSSQSLETCRTEARNAYAEARRGGLNDAPDQYTRNAVQRCAEFKGDERSACDARVLSPSRIEGSVEAGGILRESTITVPVPPQ